MIQSVVTRRMKWCKGVPRRGMDKILFTQKYVLYILQVKKLCMNIPVVDLERFRTGSGQDRTEFVQLLGRAYEEVGFVAVQNHGIPEQLIASLYETVQQFFSLPLEKKRTYQIPGLAGQRGYTSFGQEHAKGSEDC
jgi:isopenicillin N synthase-like dioxygenase